MSFIPTLFTPQNLTFILNLLLPILLLVVVIYGVISMFRKAIPHIFHLAFYLIIMVVGILCIHPLSSWLGGQDLSFIHMTFTFGEETIPLTSLQETIHRCLEAYAKTEGENSFLFLAVTNQDLASYIDGLTLLLVGYFTFFFYTLLATLLSWPLSMLIYHCAFKFIFPKKMRKYKFKKKWKSFALGFTGAFVSLCLLLSPFTAMVNTINYGVQKNRTNESQRLDDEQYNQYMQWLDAYNDSWFAKVIFGNKGNSLDIALLDYTTKTEYNGETLLFSDQISTIADTAEKLVALGLLGSGENGFTLSTLFSEGVVTTLIQTLTDSDFLMKLFPIFINIALNYAEVNDILDTSHLSEVSSLDWKKQLGQINEIYVALYDAGIINDLTSDEINSFEIPFGPETKTYLDRVFALMDESELFQTVIPAVLYSYVTKTSTKEDSNQEIVKYFSTNWDDYKNIMWGSELKIVYDSLYQIKEKTNFTFKVDKKQNQELSLKSHVFNTGFLKVNPKNEETSENNTTNQIKDLLFNHFDDVIEIFTAYDKDGNYVGDAEHLSLLDSKILMNLLDLSTLLPDQIEKMMNQGELSSYLSIDEVKDAFKEVFDKDDKEEHKTFKYETYSLLKFAKLLLGNDEFSLEEGEALLKKDAFKVALKEASTFMDDSILLSNIAPSIFENALKGVNFGKDIPLTGEDFNFRNISFKKEIPLLLDTYDDLMSLSDAMQKPTLEEQLNAIDGAAFERALLNFKKSEILNPSSKNDQNFYHVLDLVFDNEEMKKVGFYSDKSVDYSLVSSWEEEIHGIATIFTTIQTKDFISLLTGNGKTSITDMKDPDAIVDLFRSIDGSILIKNTFGAVLDHALEEALHTSVDGVSFTNVVSWEEEGTCLAGAIKAFQKLGANVSDIDWLNSNPDHVEDLLNEIVNLQFFVDKETNENHFGNYLHSILTSQEGGFADYLKDYPSTATTSYEMSKEDFSSIDWKNDGEITHLVDVIRALQNVNGTIDWENLEEGKKPGNEGLNLLTSGKANGTQLGNILDPLCDAKSLRMVSINGISSCLKGNDSILAIDGLDLNQTNISYLVSISQEERKTELMKIPTLLDEVESLDIESGKVNNLDESTIETLLATLHDMHLFNSFENTPSEPRVELTVFEQMIYTLFKEAGLVSFITQSETEEGQNAELKARILSIPNTLCGTSSTIQENEDGWEDQTLAMGEISRIRDIIGAYNQSGIDDFSGEAFLQASISNMKSLLKTMNRSILTHQAMGKFFESAVKEMGFSSFLGEEKINQMDFYLNDISGNTMDIYDQEIDLFMDVISQARVEENIDEEGNKTYTYFDFATGDLKKLVSPSPEGYGKSSVSFFALLKDSSILHYKNSSGYSVTARSEILFHLLDQSGNGDYIRPLTGTNEEKMNQLESFFVSPYSMNVEAEGKSLDSILVKLNDALKDDGNFEDLMDQPTQITLIHDIMMAAYNPLEKDTPIRAYITSEIVANYLTKNDPTQTSEDASKRIVWVKKVEGDVDFYRVDEISADQIEDLFALRRAYDNSIAGKHIDTNSQEATQFRLKAAKLDAYRADNDSYEAVLKKLMDAMFYDTICEQKITYTISGISLPEMTLNEFFAYSNDAIPGLEEPATTYLQQANRLLYVSNQLEA